MKKPKGNDTIQKNAIGPTDKRGERHVTHAVRLGVYMRQDEAWSVANSRRPSNRSPLSLLRTNIYAWDMYMHACAWFFVIVVF